jgi:hypothetical protein
MWENTVELRRPQMAIWRLRITCWIPKATNLYSEHVILIACLQQQRLNERASLLKLYVRCLPCPPCVQADAEIRPRSRISTLLPISSFSSVCGAGGIPPNALQPTEAYCANPAFGSTVHLQRRSTSDGVRDLYQRKEELWARKWRIKFSLTNATSTSL